MKTIGILALQGDIAKHALMINRLGHKTSRVRYVKQLTEIDGLVIPGGESTTIGKLLVRFGLFDPVKKIIAQGMPVFGTCAGLILLARDIAGSSQPRLGLLDITVSRNAYGPQVESFEADLQVPQLGQQPVRAVFIRAPVIIQLADNVEILARYEDRAVLVRQAKILGASFHPELTNDMRIHRLFLEMI